jgi:hypothetical protein
MRSKAKLQMFTYLLIVTLFLIMDMSFETKHIHYAYASNLSPENNLIANFTKVPLSKPSIMNHLNVTFIKKAEEPQKTLNTLGKALTKTESLEVKYKVTAYYLNIRLNPSDTSKIIKVVPKGTVLEIINTTDKGWLFLKNGGYVNGKYVKQMGKNYKQTAQVTTLSVIHTKVKDIGGAPSKPTSAVKSDSGLIVTNIEKLLKGTELAGHGLEKVIMNMEDIYGINTYFTIAVMKLESGYGKSNLSKNKNNLFGLNAIDGDESNKAFSFKTKGDSVRKFGQLISKHYLGKGFTTVEKISSKYCKANPKWSGLVKSIMNSDFSKLQQT